MAHHTEGKIVASGRPAKIREVLKIAFQARKLLTISKPKSAVQTRGPKTSILTRIRSSKAYK